MQQCLPFTVLKLANFSRLFLTPLELQQCLPFTVLKLEEGQVLEFKDGMLQQCLPFTVLKPSRIIIFSLLFLLFFVATVLTVYGIETKAEEVSAEDLI